MFHDTTLKREGDAGEEEEEDDDEEDDGCAHEDVACEDADGSNF